MLPLRLRRLAGLALATAWLLAAPGRGATPSAGAPLGDEPLGGAAAPVALTHEPGEGWPPASFDPLLVYYPADLCATQVLEVQQWDRRSSRWQPHDRHPQLRGTSCRVEDAGGLLNELRVRCIDPSGVRRPSPWRVGAELWEPSDENPCPLGGHLGADPGPLHIAVSSPQPGAVWRDGDGFAPLRGRVVLGDAAAPRHEIALALDASAAPGGAPAGDAAAEPLLAAQVRAARRLLEVLEPSLGPVRVALLSFAGGDPAAPGGAPSEERVELPLSSDTLSLLAALESIAPGGPSGGAAFPAALELAVRELSGAPGARSRPRLETRKLVLLLSDGRPALPFGEGDRDRRHWQRSLAAAQRAQREGIALHLFAVGGRGTPFSPLAYEMLHRTPGSFTRIDEPGRSDAWLERFSFAHLERVAIENLTTSQSSEDLQLTPDGRFSGRLPLTAGPNRVRITARATDGREESLEFELRYERPPSEAERFLAAERERIERARRTREAARKGLEVEVETP